VVASIEVMDIVGPLAIVAIFVTIAGLMLKAARNQQGAVLGHFGGYAKTAGLEYLAPDDGRAEAMAGGFDDFAVFQRTDGMHVPPICTVSGKVAEGQLCAFSHFTQGTPNSGRPWVVAIIDTGHQIIASLTLTPPVRRGMAAPGAGANPHIDIVDDPAFSSLLAANGPDATQAHRLLSGTVRRDLAKHMGALPFTAGLAIRGSKVALYYSDRNENPCSAEDVQALVEGASRMAALLVQAGASGR